MDSIDNPRATIAKSPLNQPKPPTTSMPALATTSSTSVPQCVSVNVPDSSSKSGTSSPLKHGSFFKSFRGRSVWDADEDEFAGGRKYSTATAKDKRDDGRLGEMPDWEGYPALTEDRAVDVPGSSPESVGANVSKPATPSELHGGGFFQSYHSHSAFDADDDEFDISRKYSMVTLKKDDLPPTPILSPSKIRSPRLSSPYPLRRPSLEASDSSPPTSMLRGGSFFKSFRGRDPFDADDDEFDNGRRYTTKTLTSLSSPITPTNPTAEYKTRHTRKVSWADQIAKAKPAPSYDTSEQAALGAKDDDSGAGPSGSTASLTSTWDLSMANLPAQLQNLDPYKTIRKAEGNFMSATLATASEISPFKGNMWEPEEEEWANVDANKVVETFKASYKSPVPLTPTKVGALSYFGTAIQHTVKSVLSSPTKKTADEKLQEEERIRDKIEELENTYHYDPDGDLNDEIMKRVFLTQSSVFNARESPRLMHIIDLDGYFNTDDALIQHAHPRLCDAVATVLSHSSKKCLDAFLNPSFNEFVYRREIDNNKGGLILTIRRNGNEVHCGAYVNFGFMKQWKLYVKSRINVTGQWHEVYATLEPGIMPIKDGVIEWGTIKSDSSMSEEKQNLSEPIADTPRKLELSPFKKSASSEDLGETDPKFMLYQGRFLARWLLWDIWYRFDKRYDCRAIWEADGMATNVRLKQALVGSEDGEDE